MVLVLLYNSTYAVTSNHLAKRFWWIDCSIKTPSYPGLKHLQELFKGALLEWQNGSLQCGCRWKFGHQWHLISHSRMETDHLEACVQCKVSTYRADIQYIQCEWIFFFFISQKYIFVRKTGTLHTGIKRPHKQIWPRCKLWPMLSTEEHNSKIHTNEEHPVAVK